jgi:hypothetical protein
MLEITNWLVCVDCWYKIPNDNGRTYFCTHLGYNTTGVCDKCLGHQSKEKCEHDWLFFVKDKYGMQLDKCKKCGITSFPYESNKSKEKCKNCTSVENGQIIVHDKNGICQDCGRKVDPTLPTPTIVNEGMEEATVKDELKYCDVCVQMTNHHGVDCLKCEAKREESPDMRVELPSLEQRFEQQYPTKTIGHHHYIRQRGLLAFIKEEKLASYEKGFEDGYATAKRLYKHD